MLIQNNRSDYECIEHKRKQTTNGIELFSLCVKVLMYNSPYWMNTDYYWIDYPHAKLQGSFKVYYLVQFGFWLQQIYVVNTDMKRKDYIAMLAHHFITCALIGGSYFVHLTRIGHAILVVMDVADVFLAVSLFSRSGIGLLSSVLFWGSVVDQMALMCLFNCSHTHVMFCSIFSSGF